MNLPNAITFGRIALVPVFLFFAYGDTDASEVAAFAAFLVASLSDSLDGYLARKNGSITTLGQFADPLADKLLVGGALIALTLEDQVAAWIVVVVLGRELAVTVLRWYAKRTGVIVPASIWGKAKMVLQCAALAALLAVPAEAWVDALLYATVAATIASGIDYAVNLRLRAEPA